MTVYTMLAIATIEADSKEEAENIMVEATPGLAGGPQITPDTALVAEGDWSLVIRHGAIDFLVAATQ